MYFKVMGNLEIGKFLKSLKQFIVYYGRLAKIYLDNGKTFVSVVKWIKQVISNEKM